ncbi:MAG: factor 1-like [Paramarteilia canceri]
MLELGEFDKDHVIRCPYDEQHLVRQYRMARHLIKCAKNHPHIKLRTCPFNSMHHIKEEEFNKHIIECPYQFKILEAYPNLESAPKEEQASCPEPNEVSKSEESDIVEDLTWREMKRQKLAALSK